MFCFLVFILTQIFIQIFIFWIYVFFFLSFGFNYLMNFFIFFSSFIFSISSLFYFSISFYDDDLYFDFSILNYLIGIYFYFFSFSFFYDVFKNHLIKDCLMISFFFSNGQLLSYFPNPQIYKYKNIIIKLYKITVKIKKQLYQQSNQLMSDSLCQHIKIDHLLSPNLISYLTQNKIQVNHNNVGQQILKLFYEKDEIIGAMENQITKYKAQQVRNNKMITQLQQKISQICPNNNNTGSSFMMASEFKDYFQDFIKNCFSAALSPLLEYPTGYCEYSTLIFSSVYESINVLISNKMDQICEVIGIQKNAQNRNKIKNSLLKILQDDWQALLGIPKSQDNQQSEEQRLKQTSSFIQKALDFQNQQIIQLVDSQQFKQMDKKLVKICGYMILQQKKWEFLLPSRDSKKIEKYNKKDYVCIDGWIKQKEDVILVLQGLARETEDGTYNKHPNLKNYVIPFSTDEQQFKLVPKNLHEGNLKENEFNIINEKEQHKIAQTLDKSCQYSILLQQNKKSKIEQKGDEENQDLNMIASGKVKIKIDASTSNKKIKSKSTFFSKKQRDNKQNQQPTQYQQRYKQKIQTAIRKLSKIQQKFSENYFDSDSVSVMLTSNINAVNIDQIKQRDQNQGLKLNNIENICENNSNGSLCLVKSSKIQKNSSKNNHNLISDPSFEEILTLPQRKKELNDQLPLKRQSSRAKKSSSRKTSAGKIIVQCLQSKQNIQNKNNREQTREKQNNTKEGVYKEMIKQKLGTETKSQKQKEKQKQKQKTKESKNKYKDQDRPLRIMHFKKIRQKYLNL